MAVGAQILLDLGVREMILLSNTKRTIVGPRWLWADGGGSAGRSRMKERARDQQAPRADRRGAVLLPTSPTNW